MVVSQGSSPAIKSFSMPSDAASPNPADLDRELVKRAQAGDTASFDQLVVKYSPRLYGMVYHMTSNKEDTNDLMQDIFAKAYRSLDRFQGKSAFYTWIYAIGTNMTLNFLKKRKRRTALSLDDVDSGIQNDDAMVDIAHAANPRHQSDVNELQKKLNTAMQALSDDHRAVVTLHEALRPAKRLSGPRS